MGAVPDQTVSGATGAFFREPAWHGLGTVFADTITDWSVMLDKAQMAGQDIQKQPIPALVGIPADRFAKPLVAITGKIPGTSQRRVLSVASPEYEVIQPEEIVSWAQFGPTEGARWETCFQMKGGTQMGASIAFDTEIVLDPNGVADVTKMFLMVYGSYDGSLAKGGGFTPVRVVCENTLNLAISGAKQSFKVKSTKNARERVLAWQQTVVEAEAYTDAFAAEAKALFAAPLVKATFFDKVVPVFFPTPEKDAKGSFKKHESRIETLASIWNGPTSDGIRDTAWGALNTLTEANQWKRQVRSGNMENFALAGAGFDGPTNVFRQKALAVVKEVAGV